MKIIIALATLVVATPALAWENTNIMTMPLGGGFQSYSGTVNGQTFNGTSMPLGGGFQSYNYTINGQSHSGMSVPLGGGFDVYNGN